MRVSARHVWSATASFLLLAAPFLVFLKHYEYPLTRREVVICYAVIALIGAALGIIAERWPTAEVLIYAALMTLVFDAQLTQVEGAKRLAATFIVCSSVLWLFRRVAAQLLTLMTATMVVATVVLPNLRVVGGAPVTVVPPPTDAPFILHIIFDEHIGIEGLPDDDRSVALGRDLRAFYARHGFLLFGSAYSEYFHTVRSISHLLNDLSARQTPETDLYQDGDPEFEWRLERSGWFERLTQIGYSLHVYQSTYLDLCHSGGAIVRCETYDVNALAVLADAPLSALQKARVIASVYGRVISAYAEWQELLRAVNRIVRRQPLGARRARDPLRVSPLVSLAEMERVAQAVRMARRGDYILAHLLLPHHPFVYGEDCRILPLGEWLDRRSPDAPPEAVNSPESRERRYAQYAEQVRCVYRKLDALLGMIPHDLQRDVVIILQGDHGSRITLRDPSVPIDPAMTNRDFVDGYSTLFAVRSASLPVGYDTRPFSITCLAKALAVGEFRSFADLPSCISAPRVFVVDGERPDRRRIPISLGLGPAMPSVR